MTDFTFTVLSELSLNCVFRIPLVLKPASRLRLVLGTAVVSVYLGSSLRTGFSLLTSFGLSSKLLACTLSAAINKALTMRQDNENLRIMWLTFFIVLQIYEKFIYLHEILK